MIALREPPARMPSGEYPHREHDGRELQGSEELLIRRHAAKEALRRLRQAENGPEIDEQTRARHREDEGIFAAAAPRVVDIVFMTGEGEPEQEQDEQEDGEGKCLHRQPREQDIVTRIRILPIRLRGTHNSRASNLHNGRQNIRRDEPPQHQLRRQPPPPPLPHSIVDSRDRNSSGGGGPGDESVDGEVDARRDEDGRDDDEEVLHHEPNDVVRVIPGRQRAEDVADRFEQAGECDE